MRIPVNKMAHDDIHPFLQALGKAGCDSWMVEQIRSEEKDALAVVAGFLLRKKRYITPPSEQIAFVREMKRLLGWYVSEDALRAATKMIVRYDPTDLKRVPVLIPRAAGKIDCEFSALRQDLYYAMIHNKLLWPWFDHIGTQTSDLEFHEYFVQKHRLFPDYGLSWYFVDVTARKGVEVTDVTEPAEYGLATLAAAAMHPIWVLGMNGGDIPYVWVHGTPLGVGRAAREQACIYCERVGPVTHVWFRRRDARKPYPDFCVPKVVDCQPVT